MYIFLNIIGVLLFLIFIVSLIKPFIAFRSLTFSRKKASLLSGILFLLVVVLAGSLRPAAPQVKKTQHVAGVTVVATIHSTPLPSRTPVAQVVISSPTPLNKNLQYVTVTKVIDGDTIEISSGETLRYIGIDTPETVDPRRPVQCFGKEASEKNKSLVQGVRIGIEKDVSETDRYGRLLRYVYLPAGRQGEDNIFINELLVREGFAVSSSYPPDVKYQNLFRDAEKSAREKGLGLWGSCTTQKTKEEPNIKQEGDVTLHGTYVCDCAKSCSKITSCEEANFQLKTCGCSARDNDNDGIPCESVCN